MPFLKGQSGNPGGRPRVSLPDGRTLSELAREHTGEAVATLAAVMSDVDSPAAARIAAASTLLDRGWGRASQDIAVSATVAPPLDVDEARETIRCFLQNYERKKAEARLHDRGSSSEDSAAVELEPSLAAGLGIAAHAPLCARLAEDPDV